MTLNFQRFPTSLLRPEGLMAGEDVIADLRRWQLQGLRTVLVTLVSVEGGAPRQPGAQMAVAEDGQYAGYLSGGCLESAVALEAQSVMASAQNRLLRYGRGSPYFDIKLPCGSGLDLYFDQALTAADVQAMTALAGERRVFALQTDLSTGVSRVEVSEPGLLIEQSRRDGDVFSRIYAPALQLFALGTGPALTGVATLAAALGFQMTVVSDDAATCSDLAAAGLGVTRTSDVADDVLENLDFATATALFFHDHEQEPRLLRHILKSKCFYVGALGNRGVHRQRLQTLAGLGVAQSDVMRIRAPAGAIDGAKSKATLAISVLAQIMAEAKALNLIA